MIEIFFIYTLTVVFLIITTLSLYLLWVGSYWKRKGIRSYGNVIFGAFKETFRLQKCLGECLSDLYLENKREKYAGTFILGLPILVIRDREILKQLLLKEYSNFASHGLCYDTEKDPLSGHLFNLAGGDWKFMRSKLTPAFTSGRIKYMFSTVQGCISSFHKAVESERLNNNGSIHIRELLARLGTDIISSAAFGIEANSLQNTEAEFRKFGKNYLQPAFYKLIRLILKSNYKLNKYFYIATTVPHISKFFIDVVTNTIEFREKNNVTRGDFLDLLIRLKNEDDNKEGGRRITTKEIAAQAFVFFIAGFETSAFTSAMALFELAKHPEIQRKIQEECDRILAKCGGHVTYDAVQSMEYTDGVLQETMRLYPALPFIPRAVTKSCKLPLTDVYLEKDTAIWLPVLGLHMDEDFFPEPKKFDPDRFTEENKKKIPPYSYMPFGDGPRQCIGMRFATVQMKAVLLELISTYNVELASNKVPSNRAHPLTFIMTPKEDFMLKFTPRNDD